MEHKINVTFFSSHSNPFHPISLFLFPLYILASSGARLVWPDMKALRAWMKAIHCAAFIYLTSCLPVSDLNTSLLEGQRRERWQYWSRWQQQRQHQWRKEARPQQQCSGQFAPRQIRSARPGPAAAQQFWQSSFVGWRRRAQSHVRIWRWTRQEFELGGPHAEESGEWGRRCGRVWGEDMMIA